MLNRLIKYVDQKNKLINKNAREHNDLLYVKIEKLHLCDCNLT